MNNREDTIYIIDVGAIFIGMYQTAPICNLIPLNALFLFIYLKLNQLIIGWYFHTTKHLSFLTNSLQIQITRQKIQTLQSRTSFNTKAKLLVTLIIFFIYLQNCTDASRNTSIQRAPNLVTSSKHLIDSTVSQKNVTQIY